MMTSAQIAAELARKKSLGIKPTDPNNVDAYNKLNVQPMVRKDLSDPKINKLPGTLNPAPITKLNNTLGAGESYIRKTLNDSGYADGDIGWDGTRKMVTLKGADFLSPTKNIGGSTVATSNDIQSALGRFQNTQTIKRNNDLLGRLESSMNTPNEAPQFNYDPTADPVYQAAIRRAQANAQTGSGNAAAEMNRRGILNSTITGDRIAQIQQSEMGRVSDTVLPQLFDQAYGRYRDTVTDQRTDRRDKIKDIGDLLGLNSDLDQRRLDNADRDRTFDWSKDPNNPDVRGKVLQNEGLEYDLNELKDPKSVTNRTKALDLKMKELDATYLPQEQKLKLQELRKRVADIGKQPAVDPNAKRLKEIQLEKAEIELAELKNGGGGGGGGKPDSFNLDDYKGQINRSFYRKDPSTGATTFDTAGARAYILTLFPNDDAATDALLTFYGLPTN